MRLNVLNYYLRELRRVRCYGSMEVCTRKGLRCLKRNKKNSFLVPESKVGMKFLLGSLNVSEYIVLRVLLHYNRAWQMP